MNYGNPLRIEELTTNELYIIHEEHGNYESKYWQIGYVEQIEPHCLTVKFIRPWGSHTDHISWYVYAFYEMPALEKLLYETLRRGKHAKIPT